MSKQATLYENRASIIKALAHPSRLLIIDKLAGGEECVCVLTDLVGADFSTVSKHLTVLRNAGIVHSRKENNNVFYALKCPCILSFVECIDNVISDGK